MGFGFHKAADLVFTKLGFGAIPHHHIPPSQGRVALRRFLIQPAQRTGQKGDLDQ